MRRRYSIAGLALFAIGSVAHGQSQVENAVSGIVGIGVADRIRPDYQPIGGRIGSFFLYPRLDTSVQYTDNLRATNTGKISDEVIEVRPSIDLTSDWSRNLLDLRAYYSHDFHVKTSSENYSQYGAAALARLDFARDTHLQITANGDQSIEPRTDINSVNSSRSPIQYTDAGVNANLTTTFNRLTLIGNAGVTRQDFDNAETVGGLPIYQKFRNNTFLTTSIEGRYQLGGAASAIVHLERTQIDYSDNAFTGFDRNSIGYTAQVGIGLQASQLIKGDIRVGYFIQDNRDPRFIDTKGVGFSVNLTYNITPLTTIILYANRSIEPGGSTITAGNVRSTGAVTVQHELLRNLVVTGYVRYASIDPQGPLASAREYEGRGTATFYISRRFRLNLTLDHYARRGSTFGQFDVNNGSLGLAVTL